MCRQLGLTVVVHHWSFLTCPLLCLLPPPLPQQQKSGRIACSLFRGQLECSLQFFRQKTDKVSFNLVIRFSFFIGFFTLCAVLKSYLWTGCTSLIGHLAPLQTAAHVEATFKAHDFRHDNSALIRLAIYLGFVISFVHLLLCFQYLFSVFQKSFVYILPLFVTLQGSFLFFVHLLLKQPLREWNLV